MVRPEVLRRKLARAQGRLDESAAILGQPREVLLESTRERDLGTFYLFLAIQECIDIAAHWTADAGWAPPEDAGASFDLLAEHGVIDWPTADGLRRATGLRNRIAHGYASVDHTRLHDEASEGLRVLRTFLVAIAEAARI